MDKISLNNIICLAMVLTLLFSCEQIEQLIPEDTDGQAVFDQKTYVIKAGSHSTGSSLSSLSISKMTFKVTFDSTAIYKTEDPANQADINKLYGLSDCGTHHHQNSARFGWRWFNDELEIHAYNYSNGKRYFSYITSVALNEEFTYSLELTEDEYIFSLNDQIISMDRYCSESASAYKLFPYFGGDEKAPHDIAIIIEDLPDTN